LHHHQELKVIVGDQCRPLSLEGILWRRLSLARAPKSGRIEARIGLRMMPTVGIEIERAPL
jgi:hypothetical protein